jgi:hypothetical protein
MIENGLHTSDLARRDRQFLLQFNLHALFALTALTAACCGLLTHDTRERQRIAAATEALVEKGASVTRVGTMRSKRLHVDLYLRAEAIDERLLRHLKNLPADSTIAVDSDLAYATLAPSLPWLSIERSYSESEWMSIRSANLK